jgi:hypothetical protein
VIKAALVLLILMLQSPRLGDLAKGLNLRRQRADEEVRHHAL